MGAVHCGVPSYSDLNKRRQKHCAPRNLRKIRRMLRIKSELSAHKCLNVDFRAPVHTSSFEKCSSHVPLLCSYWGLRTRDENEENSSHPVLVTKLITSMQVLNLLCLCTHGDTATDTRIARSDNQPGCLVINGWSLLKWKEWNITMSNHMYWNKPVLFSNC